jgi:hypothetical protein
LECSEDGRIRRWMKSNRWKEIANCSNHNKGYNVILINKKQYTRGQIMAHAFMKHSLDDKNVVICHIDQNKLNNRIENLMIKPKPIKDLPLSSRPCTESIDHP